MELLIKHNLEVKEMRKEELKKIVEGKTAEEQEMILSLLGEEKLLAILQRFVVLLQSMWCQTGLLKCNTQNYKKTQSKKHPMKRGFAGLMDM